MYVRMTCMFMVSLERAHVNWVISIVHHSSPKQCSLANFSRMFPQANPYIPSVLTLLVSGAICKNTLMQHHNLAACLSFCC